MTANNGIGGVVEGSSAASTVSASAPSGVSVLLEEVGFIDETQARYRLRRSLSWR
jgi:hypothetical protein